MRHVPIPILVALALLPACAIVDSVSTGFRAAGRFLRGEGRVEGGLQQGEWTYQHEDGRLRARGRFEDDVQVGLWTYYYPSGQKEYEGNMVAGLRDGRYSYWHPNGNPRAAGSFENAREFGEWMFWGPRGNLVQRGTFQNGLRNGLWTSFHGNGRVSARGLYFNGEQVGRWTTVGPDGAEVVGWTPMPNGVEWVEDRWDDGTLRRSGFLHHGRQVGLWTLHDRQGDPRLVCAFENGVAHGPCVAYGKNQSILGEGRAENDRAVGTWTLSSGGSAVDVDASGFAPSMPFGGAWSGPDLADTSGPETAIGVWLAELGSGVDESLLVDMSEPAEVAPEAAEAMAAADAEPDVPTVLQPWTENELDGYADLVRAFSSGGDALEKLGSKYAKMRNRGARVPTLGGDGDAASRYVGKPLPLTVFKTPDGSDFDITELRGKRVVLVVLRGYVGGICEYCVAQTKAWSLEGAPERIEELGAELYVLFPGEANGLKTFIDAYAQLNEDLKPRYGLLYENDYIVGPMMDIEGQKVVPSTFVLDEEGICRFAYVGKSFEDRPSSKLVIAELEKLELEE